MTDFTRLTVVGAVRKADLVIPSDEALGSLIPRLMDLLGESTASVARPLTLVRATGEQLDIGLSAGEQQLEDGEQLRLVRQDDAPPPPEVADVTDVLAESHSDRAGLWNAPTREVTGAVAIGAFALVAAALLAPTLAAPGTTLGVAIAVLAVVAGILGRLRARWATIVLTSAAIGVAVPAAVFIVGQLHLRAASLPVAIGASALVLAWAAIGIGIGFGLRIRPALWGAIVGALLPALAIVLLAVGFDALGSVAITGVVSIVVCGVLPWYAMSASGLTGLDDQVVEGRLRRRDTVLLTVNTAYRALSWSTFAVALPLAGTAAALLSSKNLWAVGLGAALIIIVALRTRAFPLAVQVAALWFADALALVVGLAAQPLLAPATLAGILFALAILVAIVVAVRPAPHQRASLRRFGNTIEALAVIALLPVLLGVFNLYADLLGAF